MEKSISISCNVVFLCHFWTGAQQKAAFKEVLQPVSMQMHVQVWGLLRARGGRLCAGNSMSSSLLPWIQAAIKKKKKKYLSASALEKSHINRHNFDQYGLIISILSTVDNMIIVWSRCPCLLQVFLVTWRKFRLPWHDSNWVSRGLLQGEGFLLLWQTPHVIPGLGVWKDNDIKDCKALCEDKVKTLAWCH